MELYENRDREDAKGGSIPARKGRASPEQATIGAMNPCASPLLRIGTQHIPGPRPYLPVCPCSTCHGSLSTLQWRPSTLAPIIPRPFQTALFCVLVPWPLIKCHLAPGGHGHLLCPACSRLPSSEHFPLLSSLHTYVCVTSLGREAIIQSLQVLCQ